MTNEVKKQPIPTKEECLAFYKELAKLADVRLVPYYKMAIEALEQEPKTGHWIPVSERLPKVMDGTNGECSDDVLICVEDEKFITISTGFYGYYPSDITWQGWWCVWAHGCEQLDNKCEVLAWMPLPKPYKESEV